MLSTEPILIYLLWVRYFALHPQQYKKRGSASHFLSLNSNAETVLPLQQIELLHVHGIAVAIDG